MQSLSTVKKVQECDATMLTGGKGEGKKYFFKIKLNKRLIKSNNCLILCYK